MCNYTKKKLTRLSEPNRFAIFECFKLEASCSAVSPSLLVILKSNPAKHKHLTASISFFSVAANILNKKIFK